MHEMSLAVSAMRIVEAAIRREGASVVRRVVLEIGALAAVDRGALAFALELASRGTLAEQARFELIEIAGAGRCTRCGRESPMSHGLDSCVACGEAALRVTAGTALKVREIEIE